MGAERSRSAEVMRYIGYICSEVCSIGTGWPDTPGRAWDSETPADALSLGEKAPVWGQGLICLWVYSGPSSKNCSKDSF